MFDMPQISSRHDRTTQNVTLCALQEEHHTLGYNRKPYVTAAQNSIKHYPALLWAAVMAWKALYDSTQLFIASQHKTLHDTALQAFTGAHTPSTKQFTEPTDKTKQHKIAVTIRGLPLTVQQIERP